MKHSLPKARLFVDAPLQAAALLSLPPEQSHYLSKVMRLKQGDMIALCNGRDGEWRGEISEAHKKSTQVTLTGQVKPQAPEPDIWLCFAPIKFGRIDFLVQKATELGAAQLQPVQTQHTIVERINYERMQANAREAAEQSERLTLPEIRPMQKLEALLQHWPQDRWLVMADETGGGPPPHEALPELAGQKLALLIGPEGGFSEAELKQLAAHSQVKRISLGPRVLRADTAALAALTALQIFCGDWPQGRPDFRGENKDAT